MQPWKTLARRTVLNHSKYLTVEDHTIELPDGRVLEHWPWLITFDYVIVLPVTRQGKYLVFRQTKYAVEGLTLAPIGGHIERGEEPLVAARRELLEEMGCQADEWVHLGTYRVNGNNGAGKASLFLARGVFKVAEPDADDLEEQELLELTRAELEKALFAGEFKVLAWTTAIALSLLIQKG
ncbi:MAG: NUDIX hydrolase [Omnitrophica WOR_2 bacterium]